MMNSLKTNLLKINIDSDFEIIDKTDISVPFIFTYFTTDPEINVVASFDGETYTNCSPVEGGIVVHINAPHFPLGNVRIKREYLLTSSSFEDGVENVVTQVHTNIYIVKDECNCTSVIFEGSLTPNFDAYNIAYNVEKVLVSIQEKDEILSEKIEEIKKASDNVDEALQTVSGYDERISDLEKEVADLDLSEPVFTSSPAATITEEQIDKWDKIKVPTDLVNLTFLENKLTDYVKNNEMGNYIRRSYLEDNYYDKGQVNNLIKNFITSTYVDNRLKTYVTKTELNEDFKSYYDKHVIDDMLSKYHNKVEINSLLSLYVKNTALQNILKDYESKDELIHELFNYQKKTDMTLYATEKWVKDSGYITEAWLLKNIADITPIPNLSEYVSYDWIYQRNFVTFSELSESGVLNIDLSGYVKYTDVLGFALKTDIPDVSKFVSMDEVEGWVGRQGFLKTETDPVFTSSPAATITSSDIAAWRLAAGFDVSTAGFLTKSDGDEYYQPKGNYLTSHQDLSAYATKDYVDAKIGTGNAPVVNLENYVTWDGLNTEMDDYATKDYVLQQIIDNLKGQDIDLSNYVTFANMAATLTPYASKDYVDNRVNSIPVITDYTKTVRCTQAQYDAMVHDSNTIYLITDGQ